MLCSCRVSVNQVGTYGIVSSEKQNFHCINFISFPMWPQWFSVSLWRRCGLCVGAANHTLRPFLGCLRGLRMNGVPVDLEGKVDERTGIRRNCTGACLNASIPCRNGGQCIDGYASYSCDCNNTAFDGYYCHLGESLTTIGQLVVIEVTPNNLNQLNCAILIPLLHFVVLRYRSIFWRGCLAALWHP